MIVITRPLPTLSESFRAWKAHAQYMGVRLTRRALKALARQHPMYHIR